MVQSEDARQLRWQLEHYKGNVQDLHIASSDKPVVAYSLDAIISVGYRVRSS